MDDFEEYMAQKQAEREDNYNRFMQTCHDKITSGDLIYRSLALFIAKRFKVEIPTYGDMDGAVYHILNHYVEEVDEDFETWLTKDDAPLIRNRSELRRIFPEFKFIEDDRELVDTVNKFYNLNLELSSEYIYSLSFDFNSFVPIEVEEIHEIKEDIKVLKKYGYPTDELEAKLDEFGLDPKLMKVL